MYYTGVGVGTVTDASGASLLTATFVELEVREASATSRITIAIITTTANTRRETVLCEVPPLALELVVHGTMVCAPLGSSWMQTLLGPHAWLKFAEVSPTCEAVSVTETPSMIQTQELVSAHAVHT